MKYIPIIILIIIFITPALTLLSLRKEIGLKQAQERKVIFISGDDIFKFSFISPKKNLNSVVLRLRNITIRNAVGRNARPIYFKLLENEEIIRQLKISGSNIIKDTDIRFTFPIIKNSENKTYTVVLNSPETTRSDEIGINTDNSDYPIVATYHIPTSRLHLIFETYANIANRVIIDGFFSATWLMLLVSIIFVIKSLDI